MHKLMLILLLSGCLLLSAQEFKVNTPDGAVSVSISGVQSNGTTSSGNLIDQIGKKLEQLEKDVHSKLNKIDQKKAENLMNEIYGLLALLPDNANVNISTSLSTASSSTVSATPASAGGNVNINISGMDAKTPPPTEKPALQVKPATPPPAEEVTVTASRKAMPESEFNTLINRIKGESFADEQIRVLRTASKNFRFSCNQIVRLIDAYTYSEDKLEALRMSYPECTDPQNNYKILDAFTYSADKEAAEDIFNN
jgi:hypothetical protein